MMPRLHPWHGGVVRSAAGMRPVMRRPSRHPAASRHAGVARHPAASRHAAGSRHAGEGRYPRLFLPHAAKSWVPGLRRHDGRPWDDGRQRHYARQRDDRRQRKPKFRPTEATPGRRT